ncbi:glycosyl transferase family 1 [Clostridium polyendosporum]|uniref:Glycosyl transferase family 1 n=1 Tax=Clostridium polyendosporum TaxID=69208 RepID=A0A919RZX4_9CLOT|nr:glycosyltransferase [Clostridium polyendosporum]GIM28708.1 glycosyl transferase family 1 [Clostridium polyendosporum]
MHVLIVPSWYSSTRNKVHGSFFKEQALALQRAGVKVTIAYNEIWPLTLIGKINEKKGIYINDEDSLKTYRYKNYNFLPKSSLMFKVFNKRLEKLYKLIEKREGKIDIIHAHSSLWGGISAAYLSKKYNIPLVITEHSSLKNSLYLRESYIKHIENSYNTANVLITVSNNLKKELKDHTVNSNIKIIHNLVDLSTFYPNKIKKKEETFRFFSCAFLEEGKGMDTLLKAFSAGFKDKNAQLVIGGDGSQRENLIALSREFGIENKVFFLGALSREQVSEEMNKCDTFILASRYETFGVVYIEALACGKPIIATRNGGAEEIVEEYNGLLVDIDEINELKNAMSYMFLGASGYDPNYIRRKCIENFSEENIINQVIKVYREIV